MKRARNIVQENPGCNKALVAYALGGSESSSTRAVNRAIKYGMIKATKTGRTYSLKVPDDKG